MKHPSLVLFFVFFLSLLPACGSQGPQTLTILTHDSFAVSEELITVFEQENNVAVVFLAGGDTGAALNKAILSREAPLADIFYGVDNTFLSRALEADIFVPYESPLLAAIPDDFELDPQHRALPVDYGDVCINYDRAWFAERRLAIPAALVDLLQPEYTGLLVVENPATSSPGLAFLLATVAEFGPDGYLDFWAGLRDNGLVVVDDWETAYFTNFSASSGRGPQPLAVSYASSPAAEVIYADPPVDEAPTASLLAPGTCFRQIEFVGILRGTPNRDLAERFIDYMLDTRYQEDIPLQMFVYPVNQNAQLPPEFVQWAAVASEPAVLGPDLIAVHRDEWIAAWTEVVLR
ncbi:MAG: thiamine ABC transporter substrate-binding protein [Anaerolineales bacterium]|nr:thiamine ABC transporter substrate-binding protein [Anaerolineales bacterium]